LDISWSPDGKKILFAANLKDANTNRFDIYSIQPDGAGLTNLTNSPAAERFPTWSPDGKQIAYQYPYRNKYGVYVMRANGQEPASLVGHEFAWIDHFRWSPDGKRLAFAAQAESNFDLYIVDIYGIKASAPQLQRLTEGDADEFAPVWKH
jgi:Tol biopolymer transport system component